MGIPMHGEPSGDAATSAAADGRGGRGISGRGGLIGRSAGLVLVVLAGLWLAKVGPFAFDLSKDDVAAVGMGLMTGDSFDAETLALARQEAERIANTGLCKSEYSTFLTMLNSAALEQAFEADDYKSAEAAADRADAASQHTLYCAPTSALAWIALAWTEFLRNDYTPRFQAFIRMSDKVGPYEAWAVFTRIPLLMKLLPQLTEADRNRLRAQLALVARQDKFPLLVSLYLSGTTEQRSFLQGVLAETDEAAQKWAAGAIFRGGADIDLPLVPPRGERPWER